MAFPSLQTKQALDSCLHACSEPLAELHSAILHQAWEREEALAVEMVCVELCKPAGRVLNLDKLQERIKNTVLNKRLI